VPIFPVNDNASSQLSNIIIIIIIPTIACSINRLSVPLYLLLVPWGHTLQPRAWLVAQACVLIVWMGLQVLVLDCLRRYGARRLLPAFLMPKRYDYHRPATIQEMGSRAMQPPATATPNQTPTTALTPATTSMTVHTAPAGGRSRTTAPNSNPLVPAVSAAPAPAARTTASAALNHEADASSSSSDAVLVAECVICMCSVPLIPETSRLLTPCG
jgi:hypothetical protein